MISIEHISYSYGKKQVLTDASLNVERGTCAVIAGANGCGKSTLLSILAGIRKPSSGKILYDGTDVLKDRKQFSACIGYVPQENPLLPELTVKDNLSIWYSDSKTHLKSSLENGVLAVLNISAFLNVPVRKLSGGIKKRISIGCALAGNPPILILDEPGAALDLVCKEEIKQYLKTYLKQGGTILLTTHEEAELSLCDKLYVLKHGCLMNVPSNLRGTGLSSCFF